MALELNTSDAERIAQRYPRRNRRIIWVIAVPLAVLLVGWTVWAGTRRAEVGISAQLHGYQVQGSDRVDVTIEVYRPDPSRPGVCTVRAQSLSGQVVGETDLAVPATDQRQMRVAGTVRTVAEPVTATVGACRLE